LAKPSGIKLIFVIDMLAGWFASERQVKQVMVSYTAVGGTYSEKPDPWSLYYHSPAPMTVKHFKSFSAMKHWMEQEIKSATVLFKQFQPAKEPAKRG